MNDPFLKAHQMLPPFPAGSFGATFPVPGSATLIGLARIRAAYPPLFNLAGKLSPVSIRDQMVRGQLLAVRAHEEKLVTSDYPLLVIGAGAVTVAPRWWRCKNSPFHCRQVVRLGGSIRRSTIGRSNTGRAVVTL